jgi:hypothetical protein
MSFVLPVLLIAIILIPALAYSSYSERLRFQKIEAALRDLNVKLLLELEIPAISFLPSTFPSLKGEVQNKFFSIFIESTHKNKSLVIQVELPETDDFNFCLREQTGLDNVGIFAGEKDIEIGDPVFDRKFFVSSNQPESIRAILMNATIRKFALENYTIFEKGIINFEKGKLQYRHYSPLFVLNNKDKTLQIIEFMTILSDCIRHNSKTI